MLQKSLLDTLRGVQDSIAFWIARVEAGDMPFTDDPDADIEEQPQAIKHMTDDLRLQAGRLDTLVDVLDGDPLGG